MPDETKPEDKQALPKELTIPSNEPSEVGKHAKMLEASKDFAKHYGQADLDALRAMVGSNSILAQRVVDDLLADKFGGEKSKATPFVEGQSPQERNITGRLDHTGDVATRIKVGQAADVPPVINAK